MGLISGIRDLLGRAKGLVSTIDSRDDSLDDEDYADMVAQTEIHDVVEASKVDIYNDYGLPMLWEAEADACKTCVENAESGVLAAGNTWPSGDEAPPAHPRCRCSLTYADEVLS